MAFSKKYIGKGKQVGNRNIVEVSLKIDELQNHTFEYEGETYIKFNVAKLKEPDQFGKTHTVYVSVKEQESEES
jgi:N-acyl-L-homoserine lactone synthetase